MYFCILGGAMRYFMWDGISKTLQRFLTPSAFIDGETARHMVLSLLSGSATTRFVVMGSRPRSTHSTEA